MADAQNHQQHVSIAPWLVATVADLGNFDFEGPISGATSAASNELCSRYIQAANTAPPESSESRLFATLSAVTGMYLKARERDEPFGAAAAFADGRRSAIPADFREAHIDLLEVMAIKSTNSVLKSRLADVCWLLDRRRVAMGPLAISAYIDTLESLEGGVRRFSSSEEDGALEYRGCELLRRALSIGRAIGWEKPEVLRARDLLVRLRARASERRKAIAILWFGELDIEFSVSDPNSVAASIEELLSAQIQLDVHLTMSLWRLAARCYHIGKRNDEKYRCQMQAAEAMVAEAERIFNEHKHGTALQAAHFMSSAIAELHGAPASRERRTQLRHRLIDIQASIPDQMSTFVHHWDFKNIEEKVQIALSKGSLLEKLFMLASVGSSPDPEVLVTEAEKSIHQHPLSSLFGTVHLDRDGKAVHRTESAGSLHDPTDSAIQREIAQAESIRRNLVAATIELARIAIMQQHFMPEDLLVNLLQQSPFVPRELVGTFSRGFLRFFQGDFTSAAYVLTPLLENSLRHVLKINGHDVTVFDDASQTQQDRTIFKLFQFMRVELDTAFTKPITTDIANVFLTQPGPHLRHDFAHGLAHDSTPYGSDAVYACWLIFRLCLLPLFPYFEQISPVVH